MLSFGFANNSWRPLRIKLASHVGPVRFSYVPGAGSVDFEGLARAASVQEVYTIETEADFDAKLDLHFTAPGPAVFIWRIERADEPVPKPSAAIRQRAHDLRDALAG